jgi:aspartate racemase
MNKFKTIGVLGGMGPCSSAYFYQLLLTQSQQKYGAVQDFEYPHIIINSLALSGSNELGMEENELIVSQLLDGIKALESAGVDFIVIACNSVHNAIKKLREASSVPIISIIEEVTNKVENQHSKKVLLLSSETTGKHGLYDHLQKKGMEIIKPEMQLQKQVTQLIMCIMGNSDWRTTKSKIIEQINSMYSEDKIDSVIIGCTELPVAIHSNDTPVRLYDSLDILAESTLKYAKK